MAYCSFYVCLQLHDALVLECERGNDSGSFLDSLNPLTSTSTPQFKITAVLPPKKMWGNLEKAFIEQRRVDLQQYLHSLLMQRPVLESNALAEFLPQPVRLGLLSSDPLSLVYLVLCPSTHVCIFFRESIPPRDFFLDVILGSIEQTLDTPPSFCSVFLSLHLP